MRRRTSGRVNFRSTGAVNDLDMSGRLIAIHGEKKELPSIGKRAKNLIRDLKKSASEGVPLRSKPEIDEILKTHCKACDLSINKESQYIQCTHQECGCVMRWKATLASLHCPLRKW